jgi:hypothetical protein
MLIEELGGCVLLAPKNIDNKQPGMLCATSGLGF